MIVIQNLFASSELPGSPRSISTISIAMENAADHNANMGNETIDTAIGDLIPIAAKERAGFIRAVTAGLEDLEAGRELSFDDAAIRLGLDRGEVSS